MSKELKELLVKRAFPDPLAPDEIKAKEEYGRQWGMAIQSEWFSRTENSGAGINEIGGALFYDKRTKYHSLRLYARAEQDTKFYKQFFNADDGRDSYTNYDWTPLQIIPKFRNLVINGMNERLFKIGAEATDKYSTDLKEEYRKTLEDLMYSKSMLKQAKNLLGVNMLPDAEEDVPDSQEEIDLRMKLKFKPNVEIATEEAIQLTFGMNNYPYSQKKMLEDVFDLGVAFAKHDTDPNRGIVLRRVDPADIVYSYPSENNFDNVYYFGEVRRITLGELKRITSGKFTDAEYEKMGSSSVDWIAYHQLSNTMNYRDGDFENMMVSVMDFCFKAQNTITHKKKYQRKGKDNYGNGFTMTRKESTFDKKDASYKGYDVDKKVIDVWYKGTMILGTEYIFNYGLCENLARPEDSINKAMPPYLAFAPDLYQGRFRSLLQSMIPYVNQLQQIHLKIQQFVAKARVAGISVDIAGIEAVPLGDGNFLSFLTAQKIYDDTGSVYWSSKGLSGDIENVRPPIQELKNGLGSEVLNLVNIYNFYMNQLRESIGIPAGVDASTPNPDMLVGVQENLALSANKATRQVLDAVLAITKEMGNAVYLRLKDIFEYSHLKETYIKAIGKINVSLLESIKNFHLHHLGITIELKPDAAEKQLLEQNIQQALQQQLITLDDAIEIRQIDNIKLANQLLAIRRQKREKELRQFELQKIETNNKGAADAAERTAAAKLQEIKAKEEMEKNLIEESRKSKIAEIEAEKSARLEIMKEEFRYQMQLKGIEVDGKKTTEKMKEDEKLKRQNINNTQASAMIEQRQKDTGALNFESEVDTLEGSIAL